MKKITALLLVLVGGSLLSFSLLLSGCEKYRDAFFIFTHVRAVINGDSTISDMPMPVFPVNYDSFFIAMEMEVQETGTTAGIQWPGNNAYAFQFEDPYTYRNANPLTEIRVITLYDYNDRYPAGSNLSAICSYSEDYIGGLSQEELLQALNTYSNRDNYNSAQLHRYKIQFAEPPSLEGRQQFAIVLAGENNTLLSDTTHSFILHP